MQSSYFFAQKTWDELKKEYFDTKDIFTKKYGTPFSELECFEYPYHEGDRNELQALKDGKCKYYSFYKAKNGGIAVEISKFNSVSITYGNNTNLDKGKKEYEECLLNEINSRSSCTPNKAGNIESILFHSYLLLLFL